MACQPLDPPLSTTITFAVVLPLEQTALGGLWLWTSSSASEFCLLFTVEDTTYIISRRSVAEFQADLQGLLIYTEDEILDEGLRDRSLGSLLKSKETRRRPTLKDSGLTLVRSLVFLPKFGRIYRLRHQLQMPTSSWPIRYSLLRGARTTKKCGSQAQRDVHTRTKAWLVAGSC